MKLQTALSTAILATAVAAQSATVSQHTPPQATQAFNPANVTNDRKIAWCRGERVNCPFICGGAASDNQCSETQLTYSCVCQNGTTPDVSAFADTLPTYICEETYAQCVASHPDDLAGQNICSANKETCGTRNATAEYLASRGGGSSTMSAGASATSGGASASSGSASASATAGSNDAARYQMTSSALAAVVFAGMAFFL